MPHDAVAQGKRKFSPIWQIVCQWKRRKLNISTKRRWCACQFLIWKFVTWSNYVSIEIFDQIHLSGFHKSFFLLFSPRNQKLGFARRSGKANRRRLEGRENANSVKVSGRRKFRPEGLGWIFARVERRRRNHLRIGEHRRYFGPVKGTLATTVKKGQLTSIFNFRLICWVSRFGSMPTPATTTSFERRWMAAKRRRRMSSRDRRRPTVTRSSTATWCCAWSAHSPRAVDSSTSRALLTR